MNSERRKKLGYLCKQTFKKGSMLVTMDVVSLYHNIPHQAAIRTVLNKYRPGQVRSSNDSIVKLLEMVLTKNNFSFNGKHFLQLIGIAIGTKSAPGVANHYIDWFERMFLYSYARQPFMYVRYIDDCFLIWHHSRDELQGFVNHLNEQVPTIKFTVEVSEKEIAFLDVKIKRLGDRLVTDLFTNATDSHDYLLYSSAHPQRCKDSIPYSQFLRIRRICSDTKDFDKHIVIFSMHFLRRGYPLELLEEAAIMARRKIRSELLDNRNTDLEIKDEENRVFLINTFHPSDHTVREIVHKNWSILGGSPTTEFLYDRKLVVGYIRPKNLRDILVKAIIPFREGDELADPNYIPKPQVQDAQPGCTDPKASHPIVPNKQAGASGGSQRTLQRSILDFVLPVSRIT
jgi:hypothetical protein